jgi:bifunctional pyridoxal-dependent enzyme with beta-cystathionase and maltose regulon repressor activities
MLVPRALTLHCDLESKVKKQCANIAPNIADTSHTTISKSKNFNIVASLLVGILYCRNYYIERKKL